MYVVGKQAIAFGEYRRKLVNAALVLLCSRVKIWSRLFVVLFFGMGILMRLLQFHYIVLNSPTSFIYSPLPLLDN